MNKNSRLYRFVNRILDTAAKELEQAGVEGTHAVIQALKDWLWEWIPDQLDKIKQKKPNSSVQEMTLEDLNKMIAQFEEHMELGRQAKENEVWWAMWKLGYTKEQITEVIDLANHAHTTKE